MVPIPNLFWATGIIHVHLGRFLPEVWVRNNMHRRASRQAHKCFTASCSPFAICEVAKHLRPSKGSLFPQATWYDRHLLSFCQDELLCRERDMTWWNPQRESCFSNIINVRWLHNVLMLSCNHSWSWRSIFCAASLMSCSCYEVRKKITWSPTHSHPLKKGFFFSQYHAHLCALSVNNVRINSKEQQPEVLKPWAFFADFLWCCPFRKDTCRCLFLNPTIPNSLELRFEVAWTQTWVSFFPSSRHQGASLCCQGYSWVRGSSVIVCIA